MQPPHHRHRPATCIIVGGLPGKPVPEDDSGGVTPPPKIQAVGGSMRFENFMEGGWPATPVLKNENYALLHASRTCFPQGSSGGTAFYGTYSKLIPGGRIRPKREGAPATPSPPCRGVTPFLKKNVDGRYQSSSKSEELSESEIWEREELLRMLQSRLDISWSLLALLRSRLW